jgi:anti-sigma factor RsiW
VTSHDSPDSTAAAAAALRALFRLDAETMEHPTHEQIVAYVDATLDDVDREIVESHLATCRTCAEDVDDLRAVAGPAKAGRPVPAPAGRHVRMWYAAAGLAAAAALAGIFVWPGRQPSPAATGTGQAAPASASAPTPGSPAIVLALQDGGGTVTLDAAGTLTGLQALSASDRDVLVAALRNGRIAIPAQVTALRGRQGTLLTPSAAPATFQSIGPMATAVESERPTFEWTPLAGATAYVVSVFDPDLDKVAESEPQSTLRWTPARPLARGRVYSWQVRARTATQDVISPTPPAPEARFRVVTQAEADQVAAVRRDYARSPLALGVLLAGAGLLDDADRQLAAVVSANPASQEAARLLASVRDRRQ